MTCGGIFTLPNLECAIARETGNRCEYAFDLRHLDIDHDCVVCGGRMLLRTELVSLVHYALETCEIRNGYRPPPTTYWLFAWMQNEDRASRDEEWQERIYYGKARCPSRIRIISRTLKSFTAFFVLWSRNQRLEIDSFHVCFHSLRAFDMLSQYQEAVWALFVPTNKHGDINSISILSSYLLLFSSHYRSVIQPQENSPRPKL